MPLLVTRTLKNERTEPLCNINHNYIIAEARSEEKKEEQNF